MKNTFLGEFEQMVLLTIMRLGNEAFALSVIRELDERVGRRVSRGTLYKTLERLEEKELVAWEVEEATPDRGGHPRRRFRVTSVGVASLRVAKDTLSRLWDGLDGVLGGRANE